MIYTGEVRVIRAKYFRYDAKEKKLIFTLPSGGCEIIDAPLVERIEVTKNR